MYFLVPNTSQVGRLAYASIFIGLYALCVLLVSPALSLALPDGRIDNNFPACKPSARVESSQMKESSGVMYVLV